MALTHLGPLSGVRIHQHLGRYHEVGEEVLSADDELKREAADVINLALVGTVVSRRRRAA